MKNMQNRENIENGFYRQVRDNRKFSFCSAWKAFKNGENYHISDISIPKM